MVLKIGKSVRFENQQRLDIPDALRFQSDVYDALRTSIAAMLGGDNADGATLPVGGTLTRLVFQAAGSGVFNITSSTGKAVFAYVERTDINCPDAQIIEYLGTSASGQQTSINLSSYTAGQTPVIWARRIEIHEDVDTRKKWSELSGSETVFPWATSAGYRVEFQATTGATPPSSDTRWFAIAQVISISSGGNYTFRLIHPLNGGVAATSAAYRNYFGSTATGPLQHIGIGTIVRDAQIKHAELQSNVLANQVNVDNALAGVNTSLSNIASDISSLETQDNAMLGTITNVSRVAPRFVLTLRYLSGTWSIIKPNSAAHRQVTGQFLEDDLSVLAVTTWGPWAFTITLPASFLYAPATLQATVHRVDSVVFEGTPTPITGWPYIATPIVVGGASAQKINVRVNTLANTVTNGFNVDPVGITPDDQARVVIVGYAFTAS